MSVKIMNSMLCLDAFPRSGPVSRMCKIISEGDQAIRKSKQYVYSEYRTKLSYYSARR